MRSWRGWSWDDGNFGGSGLEPLDGCLAVRLSKAFHWAGVHSGARWRSSASTAATCGAAVEVPVDRANSSPLPADRMSRPGAHRSGRAERRTVALPLKAQTRLRPSTAPTAITPA